MTDKSGRITQLDGVRALAITAVFLHHGMHVRLLWTGVDLFFVLSGFLITGILYNQRNQSFKQYIGRFYTRRARRILPPYLILLIVVSIVVGTWWLKYWYMYLGAMNFLLPLGIPTPQVLPLASLAIEEQFYLLWPFAVFYLPRKALLATSIAFIVCAPILRFFCTPLFHNHWAIYMLLPFRMDTLAAGALLALLWPELSQAAQGKNRRIAISTICIAAIAISFISLIILGHYGYTTSSNRPLANMLVYEAALFACTGLLILALIGTGRRFFECWPLVWIGRISYSIYLFHQLTLYLWPGHIFLDIVAFLAIAVVMWFLVELPLQKLNRTHSKVLVNN